jgi:flagellar biosynthesis protein FlhG
MNNSMETPPESRPVIEPAQMQFIEANFNDFLGVRPTDTDSMKAWRGDLAGWIHERLFEFRDPVAMIRAELNQVIQRTRTIAITSGKGGVGKTTFSVNLAVACAQLGRRVLLFDADFGMANVHIYAGVNPEVTLLDVIDGRATVENVILPGPGGIHLICGASGNARMSDLNTSTLDSLGRELLRIALDFDVLIIDTGAGISSAVTHFLGLAQETIVVATPGLASVLDAYGVIKLAHENRLATRIHLLVNQAEAEYQAEGVSNRIAGCANRFLASALHTIGFLDRDAVFEQSTQSRRPLMLSHPNNPNARRIQSIATQLLDGDKVGSPAENDAETAHAAA